MTQCGTAERAPEPDQLRSNTTAKLACIKGQPKPPRAFLPRNLDEHHKHAGKPHSNLHGLNGCQYFCRQLSHCQQVSILMDNKSQFSWTAFPLAFCIRVPKANAAHRERSDYLDTPIYSLSFASPSGDRQPRNIALFVKHNHSLHSTRGPAIAGKARRRTTGRNGKDVVQEKHLH